MGAYDMAIGLDSASVNQISSAVYTQLYPGIFKGSEKVDFAGAELTLDYDVQSAPVFKLTPPDSGAELVAEHLASAGVKDNVRWTVDERAAAILMATQDNVFQIVMNDFMLTIDDGDGKPATDKLEITVIAQANSAGGELRLVPLKAIAKASNPADQALVNQFIVPKAMEMMKTLLAGITLPPLSIPGVSLTPPALVVLNNRLIALANIAGKSVPAPPFPDAWPGQPFFALIGPELRATVAALAAGQFNWSGSQSGSVGSSIGGASYSASAAMMNAHVTAPPQSPTVFNAAVDIRGNVGAKVTFMCVPVGVNYDLSPNHSPITATIQASISGLEVRATVTDIEGFTIILTPSGSIIEKIISAITWPITQAVTAAFSPSIIAAIRGVTFPVMTVPSFPYTIENVHLTITPVSLALTNWNNDLAVVGNVSIN